MKTTCLVLFILVAVSSQGQDSLLIKPVRFPVTLLGYPQGNGAVCTITCFRNDSLVLPDSLFERYGIAYWSGDTIGTLPWYDDTLPNGWGISWPEGYTDGGFYFRVYRNYLVAQTSHDNPNPNDLLYVQSIDNKQFLQITDLMMGDKLSQVVRKDTSSLYGKRFINFSLDLEKLGLYDAWIPDTSNPGYFMLRVVSKEDAELQFYKGLTAIISVMNLYLDTGIPIPGEEYKHCYSHSVMLGEPMIPVLKR